MDRDAPPTTIHTPEELAPRGPWSFLVPALPGGFTRWGWGLMAGWALMIAGPSFSWAALLRRSAGWSALPGHWGEGISARDIWELVENGGLKYHLTNSPTVHTLGLGLVVVFWCGWRMQAEAADLPGRLGPWLLGALDTLLVGFLPVGLAAGALVAFLGWLGGFGIEGLGWLAFVGRPLVIMAAFSALGLQWWLLRLGRAHRAELTHPGGYFRHLGQGFLRLWNHPVQWGVLVFGGTAIRSLLSFLVLLLAWRLGGTTVGRVWTFFLLQVFVTLLNAWLLGWFLRTAARYWNHDQRVREVRADLEKARREAIIQDA